MSVCLISAPKSSVTLFTPDPAQANTHPKIKIADSEIPLVRSPKLLGVYQDTFFSFNKHCVQVSRYNLLNKLANSKLVTNASTIRTTALTLCYSIEEYATYADILDPKLNKPCGPSYHMMPQTIIISSSSGCLTGSWSVWSHAVTPHSTIYHLVFVI